VSANKGRVQVIKADSRGDSRCKNSMQTASTESLDR